MRLEWLFSLSLSLMECATLSMSAFDVIVEEEKTKREEKSDRDDEKVTTIHEGEKGEEDV